MQDLAAVWRQFKATGDPNLCAALVEHYQNLVRNLALGILRKLRAGTELDDLIADGNFGLVRAIDGFDPERGFKFETYATPVIRGAIYNGLRRMDWLPERTRAKARQFQRAHDTITQRTGREPSEAELAEELKISAEEVYDLIANMGCIYLLSLDQPLSSEDSDTTMMDLVEASPYEDPATEVEFMEQREIMRNAIDKLDDRHQFLIKKHYFEGITFESIARELGVSKQRVSQMHSAAVKKLRIYLGDDTVSSEAMQDFLIEGQI
ncbi:MAG: FliA/WhiG family RNA polymerase sigma factor [Candidatus Eremiobacterota bacterium]